MPRKRHRSVALTSDLIEFIEDERGAFSFSAYLEHLCWKGARGESGTDEGNNARSRRSVFKVR